MIVAILKKQTASSLPSPLREEKSFSQRDFSIYCLENKGYIIWKLDEKKERTYLVLTNKAIELSNCQKEKMIEAYEKIKQ